MNEAVCVTVLTPTYNRAHLLGRLFQSLCEQTSSDFQWLVIDDGSTDGTEAFFSTLPAHPFELEYHKKENGGKHTALNYSHPYIRGEMVMIVDSDDYLPPEAVETIEKEWTEFKSPEVAVVSYQKCLATGELCAVPDEQDTLISDEISYRTNENRGGDRCEVLRADVMKSLPFPVFENEKFMSEGWLWRHIAYDYMTVYRNVPLYIVEYQRGGLSDLKGDLGRTLRIRSPYGMMENYRSFFDKRVCVRARLKAMLKFCVYGKFAGLSLREIIKTSGGGIRMIPFVPFGCAIYLCWRRKYLKGP